MCKPYLSSILPLLSSASFLLTWHATLWFYMPQCFLRDTGLLPSFICWCKCKNEYLCECVSVCCWSQEKKRWFYVGNQRSTEEEQAVHLLSLPCIHHRQDTQICACVCTAHLMHEKPNQRWGCKTAAKRHGMNEKVTEKTRNKLRKATDKQEGHKKWTNKKNEYNIWIKECGGKI